MMNVLALSLVLTSILTAGFFTPTPQIQKSNEDVIVKEGHRIVVVEYEKDDGNTKVSISPQDSQAAHKVDDKMSERTENMKETIKEETHDGFSPKDLVCDAYGKCKKKITSAIGKTTEAAAAAGEMAAEGAKETVHEAIGKVKDTAHKASDKVQESKETLKESVSEISSKTKHEVTEMEKEGEKEFREIVRRVNEVGADIFHYVFPQERVKAVTGILHLMGFAAAYGMCVWVTFASSYVLAGALPRLQFAMVQSKIYPVYFKAMAYSVGMAILGNWMSEGKMFLVNNVGLFRGFELMAALVMILVNLMWLEPKANKVMVERMKKEKEEGKVMGGIPIPTSRDSNMDSIAETAGRGRTTTTPVSTHEKPEQPSAAAMSEIIELSRALQRLNSYSSFLNVLTLMSLTWHLGHLGQRLHTVC